MQCLYRTSRQAATATDMESLVDITLRMPEEVFKPVATSLILRDRPESPWTLAGTRNLGAWEDETLTARLVRRTGDWRLASYAALSWLRAYYRAVGMSHGVAAALSERLRR